MYSCLVFRPPTAPHSLSATPIHQSVTHLCMVLLFSYARCLTNVSFAKLIHLRHIWRPHRRRRRRLVISTNILHAPHAKLNIQITTQLFSFLSAPPSVSMLSGHAKKYCTDDYYTPHTYIIHMNNVYYVRNFLLVVN